MTVEKYEDAKYLKRCIDTLSNLKLNLPMSDMIDLMVCGIPYNVTVLQDELYGLVAKKLDELQEEFDKL